MRSPVVQIIDEVAEAKGTDSQDLDLVLADYIDPDALGLLAAHETSTWTLSFELPTYVVTVESDGTVAVDPK